MPGHVSPLAAPRALRRKAQPRAPGAGCPSVCPGGGTGPREPGAAQPRCAPRGRPFPSGRSRCLPGAVLAFVTP